VGVLLFFGGAVALYMQGSRRLRLGFLVAVAVVMGLAWNLQLAVDSVLIILSGSLPPASTLSLGVLAGGLLLTLVLAGSLFCGYLCPLGALLELLSLAGLKWSPGPRPDRALRHVKYGAALLCLLAALVGPSARAFFAGDPLLFAFRLRWDGLGGSLLLLVLAASLVWSRPWCRYLCPLGALNSLWERVGLLTRWAPRRRTEGCHLGVQVGRDWDCLRCNRCLSREAVQPQAGSSMVGRAGLVLVVLAALSLAGARVVLGPSRVSGGFSPASGSRGSQEVPADREPVLQSPLQPASRVPRRSDVQPQSEAPRLQRRDNDPYKHQRKVVPSEVRLLIQQGRMSDHEARHYLPVE